MGMEREIKILLPSVKKIIITFLCSNCQYTPNKSDLIVDITIR